MPGCGASDNLGAVQAVEELGLATPPCDVAVGSPIHAAEKAAVTRDRSTACAPPNDLQQRSRLQTTEEEDEA